jgi:predicted aconitase with swiveling domain
VEPATGLIIDGHHPAQGQRVAGRILVMPHGRGSSSSSTVLAEGLGAGTGPLAILLGEPDGILLLGALVARELGLADCPIVVIGAVWQQVRDGDLVSVAADGSVQVGPTS